MRHYFHVSRVNLRSAEEHSSSPWLLVLFCFQRKKGIIVKLDEPKVAKWAEVRQSHLKTYRKEEKFKNNSGKTLNLMWLTKCKVETIKTRQETGGQKNLKKKRAFLCFLWQYPNWLLQKNHFKPLQLISKQRISLVGFH